MKKISKLGEKEKIISYNIEGDKINFIWRSFEGDMDTEIFDEILAFLRGKDWIPQGEHIMQPERGGVGEFLLMEKELSPRFAAMLLAVMVNEDLVEFKVVNGKVFVKEKKTA